MPYNLNQFEVLRSNQRGHAKHGWLDSKHTFSFSNYYNPRQMHFSDLRVINDDWIDGGHGFPMHHHDNMEIFSYVLEGALAHKDSMGNGETILPGDVQLMSAGTGVHHSEFNPNKDTKTHLLQIWLFSNEKDVQPTYQQKHFSDEQKRGKLRLIISNLMEENSLYIRQNAKIYAGLFDGEEKANIEMYPNRSYFVHVARGSVTVNGIELKEGDALKIFDGQGDLNINNGVNSEILLFDLNKH